MLSRIPLVEVRRSIHKVVEHIIRQGGYSVVGRHANRRFIDLTDAEVVEGNS